MLSMKLQPKCLASNHFVRKQLYFQAVTNFMCFLSLNPFPTYVLFLYALKTSENLRFGNGLLACIIIFSIIKFLMKSVQKLLQIVKTNVFDR